MADVVFSDYQIVSNVDNELIIDRLGGGFSFGTLSFVNPKALIAGEWIDKIGSYQFPNASALNVSYEMDIQVNNSNSEGVAGCDIDFVNHSDNTRSVTASTNSAGTTGIQTFVLYQESPAQGTEFHSTLDDYNIQISAPYEYQDFTYQGRLQDADLSSGSLTLEVASSLVQKSSADILAELYTSRFGVTFSGNSITVTMSGLVHVSDIGDAIIYLKAVGGLGAPAAYYDRSAYEVIGDVTYFMATQVMINNFRPAIDITSSSPYDVGLICDATSNIYLANGEDLAHPIHAPISAHFNDTTQNKSCLIKDINYGTMKFLGFFRGSSTEITSEVWNTGVGLHSGVLVRKNTTIARIEAMRPDSKVITIDNVEMGNNNIPVIQEPEWAIHSILEGVSWAEIDLVINTLNEGGLNFTTSVVNDHVIAVFNGTGTITIRDICMYFQNYIRSVVTSSAQQQHFYEFNGSRAVLENALNVDLLETTNWSLVIGGSVKIEDYRGTIRVALWQNNSPAQHEVTVFVNGQSDPAVTPPVGIEGGFPALSEIVQGVRLDLVGDADLTLLQMQGNIQGDDDRSLTDVCGADFNTQEDSLKAIQDDIADGVGATEAQVQAIVDALLVDLQGTDTNNTLSSLAGSLTGITNHIEDSTYGLSAINSLLISTNANASSARLTVENSITGVIAIHTLLSTVSNTVSSIDLTTLDIPSNDELDTKLTDQTNSIKGTRDRNLTDVFNFVGTK